MKEIIPAPVLYETIGLEFIVVVEFDISQKAFIPKKFLGTKVLVKQLIFHLSSWHFIQASE